MGRGWGVQRRQEKRKELSVSFLGKQPLSTLAFLSCDCFSLPSLQPPPQMIPQTAISCSISPQIRPLFPLACASLLLDDLLNTGSTSTNTITLFFSLSCLNLTHAECAAVVDTREVRFWSNIGELTFRTK